MMASKKQQMHVDITYCPKDKIVRMKSLYVRGPRKDGQPWLVLGRMCPVCKHQEIDSEVLTKGY